MNEIKTAIVLAAGSSRRMGDLANETPKCMLEYRGEPMLARLFKQLKKNNIEKAVVVVGYKKEKIVDLVNKTEGLNIVVVENPRYAEDVNIYSMHLALKEVDDSVVIFEADAIMEDHMVTYVSGSDFEGKSVWFTKGQFTSDQYGGILKSDEFGKIVDIMYTKQYLDTLSFYTKLTGVMRVHRNELPMFKYLVQKYAMDSIQQYFLQPWMDNLHLLPCVEGNVQHYTFATFNSPEDYQALQMMDFDPPVQTAGEVQMISPQDLKHIEQYNEERVQELMKKIQAEGVWTKPMYIEKNHNLVLDGQHRLQVALRLGLTQVPVQGFHYEDVSVWTLRKELHVDVPTVINKANQGYIYPYKTVKHKFPNVINECSIVLDNLMTRMLPEEIDSKQEKSQDIESVSVPTKNKFHLIILAAGQGFKLDGINKLLVRDPISRKTILQQYIDLFPQYEITVVTGFKAVAIMSLYPQMNYVYNPHWRITGNSYSLSLALDDRPTIVISSDLIFDESLASTINNAPENVVFVHQPENKAMNTVRCKSEGQLVKEMYIGEDHDNSVSTGIFKISSPKILKEWKRSCNNNRNTFAGVNLPLTFQPIHTVDIGSLFFHEINTPLDYLNLIKRRRDET
jgi:choline kinase